MQINSSQKNLLDILIKDEKKVKNKLYSAGPYWKYKTKRSLYWLKKKGLNNFRGIDSCVGTSFADNIVLDTRKELGFKGKLVSWITQLPIISRIYDEQIHMASNHISNHDGNFMSNNTSFFCGVC